MARQTVATPAAQDITYPHIVKTPGVRGGKARIDGTRIAVADVAIAYQQGHTPAEIQTLFSSRPLTPAEVHAALAYHYDHPEELDAYLQRSEQIAQELEARKGAAGAHPVDQVFGMLPSGGDALALVDELRGPRMGQWRAPRSRRARRARTRR